MLCGSTITILEAYKHKRVIADSDSTQVFLSQQVNKIFSDQVTPFS